MNYNMNRRRRGLFGRRTFGNPILSSYLGRDFASTGTMEKASYKGVFIKTFAMLLLTALAFFITLVRVQREGQTTALIVTAFIGLIMAIVIVIVAYKNPASAMFLGPAYSLLQGFILAAFYGVLVISGYQDILLFALVATLGIFFTMLLVYRLRLINVNHKFRSFVLGGLFFVLIMSFLFYILFATGVLGETFLGADILTFALIISVIGVVYGALTLLVDFKAIEDMVEAEADKQLEWLFSLSLVISLIYIYYQMVRIAIILLARSQRKR